MGMGLVDGLGLGLLTPPLTASDEGAILVLPPSPPLCTASVEIWSLTSWVPVAVCLPEVGHPGWLGLLLTESSFGVSVWSLVFSSSLGPSWSPRLSWTVTAGLLAPSRSSLSYRTAMNRVTTLFLSLHPLLYFPSMLQFTDPTTLYPLPTPSALSSFITCNGQSLTPLIPFPPSYTKSKSFPVALILFPLSRTHDLDLRPYHSHTLALSSPPS